MGKTISLEKLSLENVKELSEENAFVLLNSIISDLPKEKQPYYESIITTTFEFRSISSSSRNLKGDLSMFGFKFFENPSNKKLLMGIRRKK